MSRFIEAIVSLGKIYTNQTGCFPVTSIKGTEYLFVLYFYDDNAIITKLLKDSTGKEILIAYKTVHEEMANRRFKPARHYLENKASEDLKTFKNKNQLNTNLSLPICTR